jgi:hypothetical protein
MVRRCGGAAVTLAHRRLADGAQQLGAAADYTEIVRLWEAAAGTTPDHPAREE